MVVEGEKTRSVLTFYFLFRSYSSLLSVSHIKFSHMMTRFVVSAKPPDCREVTSSPAAATLISHVHQKKKKQRLWFYGLLLRLRARVRACVCVCVRADPGGVPLRLRCSFHSTGTPTLSRYIVDIRPLTSLYPLIHNIVSAVRLCVGAVQKRARTLAIVRSGAWRMALPAASSNLSPRARGFGGLTPPLSPLSIPPLSPPSTSSRCTQQEYDGERWHKALLTSRRRKKGEQM